MPKKELVFILICLFNGDVSLIMFLKRKPLRLRNEYHTTSITSIIFYDELILIICQQQRK